MVSDSIRVLCLLCFFMENGAVTDSNLLFSQGMLTMGVWGSSSHNQSSFLHECRCISDGCKGSSEEKTRIFTSNNLALFSKSSFFHFQWLAIFLFFLIFGKGAVASPFTYGFYPGLTYDSNEGLVMSLNLGFYYQPDSLVQPFSSGIDPLRIIYSTKGQRNIELFWDNPSFLLKKIRWNLYAQYYRHLRYDFVGRDDFIYLPPDLSAIVDDFYFYEKERTRLIGQWQIPLFPKTALLTGFSLNRHWNKSDSFSYLNFMHSRGFISNREYSGGSFYTARLGLLFDSRDDEKNPQSGWWNELIFSPTVAGLGDFQFHKLFVMVNCYGSPAESWVLTPRLTFQKSWGNEPFFSLVEYVNSLERYEGIGGNYSVRGLTRNRLVGSEQLTLNIELRYMTFHHEFRNEQFDFQFLLFHDLGGVNLSSEPLWMNGYGAGLRLYWNKVFLITFFAGTSKETGLQFY